MPSGALYFPDAHQMREPYRLCLQLFAVFQQPGGRFARQGARGIRFDECGIDVVMVEGGQDFDSAIICTGAWSRALLRDVGLDVPIETERRFVMSPLDSGLRVVGMTELGGLKLKPFRRRFAALRHHTYALLPSLKRDTANIEEWMGHRPTLPDSLPVSDRHPRYPRLLFAFGHQHLGLTQAAISAELVVDLLNGRSSAIDPTPFRVDRF